MSDHDLELTYLSTGEPAVIVDFDYDNARVIIPKITPNELRLIGRAFTLLAGHIEHPDPSVTPVVRVNFGRTA